jgi:mevalonate pyrophosphate decarboxylase
MKATASAHPVQELVKLPGSKDNPRGVHLRDAISVCTAPLKTLSSSGTSGRTALPRKESSSGMRSWPC